MTTKVKVTTTYNCSLERAFRTPLLCDVTKIHTGFVIMPRVTHCTEDEDWGKVGASKKIFVTKSLTQKGGFAAIDKILERVENECWKFEVSQFQSWMFGFSSFTAEWRTTELATNKIFVEYTYTLHSNVVILYPINWLIAKTFWKTYMRHVFETVRCLIQNHEPYKYE